MTRFYMNYRIFKPTNHQTPQALNVNGEALNEVKHRNPKTAKPQKRALPLKCRRHRTAKPSTKLNLSNYSIQFFQ